MAHDQPTYASVPGIRVFGMMCVKPNANFNTKRKPLPPVRDQYQSPSPYYQRYKKHATAPAQTVTERISRQTDFEKMDLGSVPTTRATTIDAAEPRDAGTTLEWNTTPDQPSTTEQSTEGTTGSTVERNAMTHEIENRIKRMIEQLNTNERHSRHTRSIPFVGTAEEIHRATRQSTSDATDWPDVSWPKIRKQMSDIHWD